MFQIRDQYFCLQDACSLPNILIQKGLVKCHLLESRKQQNIQVKSKCSLLIVKKCDLMDCERF